MVLNHFPIQIPLKRTSKIWNKSKRLVSIAFTLIKANRRYIRLTQSGEVHRGTNYKPLVVPLVAGDIGADDSSTKTSSSSSATGLGGSTWGLTTQQNMLGYTPVTTSFMQHTQVLVLPIDAALSDTTRRHVRVMGNSTRTCVNQILSLSLSHFIILYKSTGLLTKWWQVHIYQYL